MPLYRCWPLSWTAMVADPFFEEWQKKRSPTTSVQENVQRLSWSTMNTNHYIAHIFCDAHLWLRSPNNPNCVKKIKLYCGLSVMKFTLYNITKLYIIFKKYILFSVWSFSSNLMAWPPCSHLTHIESVWSYWTTQKYFLVLWHPNQQCTSNI